LSQYFGEKFYKYQPIETNKCRLVGNKNNKMGLAINFNIVKLIAESSFVGFGSLAFSGLFEPLNLSKYFLCFNNLASQQL